ncbi:MAG: hypothetical protein M1379_09400 [Firmicutes bacterium]|nr:hypothetical protein [Bacillota bacterium]
MRKLSAPQVNLILGVVADAYSRRLSVIFGTAGSGIPAGLSKESSV